MPACTNIMSPKSKTFGSSLKSVMYLRKTSIGRCGLSVLIASAGFTPP